MRKIIFILMVACILTMGCVGGPIDPEDPNNPVDPNDPKNPNQEGNGIDDIFTDPDNMDPPGIPSQ